MRILSLIFKEILIIKHSSVYTFTNNLASFDYWNLYWIIRLEAMRSHCWDGITDQITKCLADVLMSYQWEIEFCYSGSKIRDPIHRKILSKSMSGKDKGIPIYFSRIGKFFFHILGNLWKLVSHIWELCGFFNSTGFYSNTIVWEYISFPQNISVYTEFTINSLLILRYH